MVKIISDNKGGGDPNRISYGKKAGLGFQYILKHGLSPMTLPSDVGIIRTVCLSSLMTVVYTDRVLEPTELKKFDIPNEWENSKYLEGLIL